MALWALGLTTSSSAQTHAVSGQSGILGEWELTATVTKEIGWRRAAMERSAEPEAHRVLQCGRT